MRAFVKESATPRHGAVRDVAEPTAGPGEVVLRVAACGICGSDLHALNSDPGFEWLRPPVTMGHELAGTVEQVGPGAGSWREGDRAVAISIQGCLRCDDCRAGFTQRCAERRIIGLHYDGGLAERVRVPADQLVAVPDGVSLRHAPLAEPLSVAVRAVLVTVHLTPGDRVVVSGPGPIGLLSGLLAQRSGAEVCVVGTEADVPRRLKIADGFGMATVTADGDVTAAIRDRLGGHAPDVWVEASGAPPALTTGLAALRRGGTMSVVSLFADPVTFFPTDAVRSELTIRCSYASTHPEYVRALELLAAGFADLEPLLDVIELPHARVAFDDAYAGKVVKPLIVMDPALV